MTTSDPGAPSRASRPAPSEVRRTFSSRGASSVAAGSGSFSSPSAPAFFAHTPTEVTLYHYKLWRDFLASTTPIVELRCPPVPHGPASVHGPVSVLPEDVAAAADILLAPCELTVVCRERPGLLADISNFLTAKRLSVANARIFTLPNDTVIDIFQLRDATSILRFDDVAQTISEDLSRLLDSSSSSSSARSLNPSPPPSQTPSLSSLAPPPSRGPALDDAVAGGAGFSPTRDDLVRHWGAPPRARGVTVAREAMARSFSNLAIVDMEKRAEMEAARRAREDDVKRLAKGETLHMYSAESLNRYCFDFKVSRSQATLSWGRNSTLDLRNCVGVYYGVEGTSRVFAELENAKRRVDPAWLCFSVVGADGTTLDLAASSDDVVDAWVLGLQSLCRASPSAHPRVRQLTYEGMLSARARMKLLAAAERRNVSTRRLVLDAVRETSEAMQHQMDDRVQSMAVSHDALRSELDALGTQVRELRNELERANDRESVLKTKLLQTQQAWETEFKEIRLIELISGGSFSEMWKAKWRGTDVACKMLKAQEASEDAVRELYSEVTTLCKLRHPNIVLFMTACPRPPHLSIVTEFCHGGNVFNAIRRPSWRRNLQHVDFVSMARDAGRGMLYLHSARIVHRDLKSQNLLLDRPVEAGRPTVKVADFGLSRVFSDPGGTDTDVMTSETGTYRWMAPEVIRHEPYCEKADVYSYGVLLWEFFSGEIPFADMTPIQAAFAVADKSARPTPVSEWARSNPPPPAWAALIERCWSSEPRDRPPFDVIVEVLDEMEKASPSQVPAAWSRITRFQTRARRSRAGTSGGGGDLLVGGGGVTGRFGSPPASLFLAPLLSVSPSE